jgi:2-polyprenyl-3-methyl-5-hydroxy-6-metoxy-1,4-benzoquinol methylase
MEFVLQEVKRLDPGSIADIGTGDGRLVRELAIMLPTARITGIDYSERAIQLARALNPTLEFRCLDITTNPPEEKFELLSLIEVFEHIPPGSAGAFASSLRPILRDDGHLLVTVPHKNVPVSTKHFQHFSAESLSQYFAGHFVPEEMVFLDKRSMVVDLIRSVMENKYFILKHWGIRNRLYRAYKRFYLLSEESRCGRIYIRFRPR